MCCDGKRTIVEAQGKSIEPFYKLITPYNLGATTSGKVIFAGPVEITNAFEACNGVGSLLSLSIREFNTPTKQKLDIDVVFLHTAISALTINAVTGFTDASPVLDTVSIVTADYKDKGDYWEARADLSTPFIVYNASEASTDKHKLWFLLVARDVKTYTSVTRLGISINIESH